MPEAIELATAYVSLTVSARGMQRQLDQEVGTAAKAAGQSARRSIEGELSAVNPRVNIADSIGGPGAVAAARASARQVGDAVGDELSRAATGTTPGALLSFTSPAAIDAARAAGARISGGLQDGLGASDPSGGIAQRIVGGLRSAETGARESAGRIASSISAQLDRIDTDQLAKVGTVALGAAAAGGAALYSLADAAGDYGETVSKATVVLGEDAVSLAEEFAAAAVETAGISKRAALDAVATFSVFGKAAGKQGEDLADFSTQLVQLAGDMASFGNTTVDEAIFAIGAGLRGESEPLRQYGVLLDDATLKAKALELGIYDGNGSLTAQQRVLAAQAEILAQTTDAQGDYLRTSDSFANRQRALTAELDNLKVELGEGVLPAANAAVGGLSAVVDVVDGLPGPVKEGATAAGALVVGLSALGGGVSLLGSGLGTLNEYRKKIGEAAKSGDGLVGSLKNISPAAIAATAGLGVGIGIFEAWYSASSAAAQGNQDFADSLLDLNLEDPTAETRQEIDRLLEGTQDGTERFRENWREAGLSVREVAVAISQRGADFDAFRDSVDGVGGALEGLSDKFDVRADPANLAEIRDAAKEAGPEVEKFVNQLADSYEAGRISGDVFRTTVSLLAETSKGYKLAAEDVGGYASELVGLIQEQEGALSAEQAALAAQALNPFLDFETRRQALQQLAEAYPELAAEVSSVIAPTDTLKDSTDGLTAAQETAQEATDRLEGALGQLRTVIDLNSVGAEAFAAGVSAYNEAVDKSSTLDDQVSSAFALSDATSSFAETAKDLPKSLDPALIAFRGFSEEQAKAFDTVTQAGDGIADYLGILASTGSYDQAIGAGNLLRLSYLSQLEQVGITGQAAQDYLEVLGLTPEQVETAITLTGAEEAATKLSLYGDLLADEVPPEVKVEIATKIAEGDVQGAAARYEEFLADLRAESVDVPVTADTTWATAEIDGWARQQQKRTVTIDVTPSLRNDGGQIITGGLPRNLQGRADGGPQAAREIGWIGERGPELWWPDTAGTVLNMEQVAAAVAGAGDQSTPSRTVQITNRFDGLVDPVQMASAQAQAMRDAEWLEAQGAFG